MRTISPAHSAGCLGSREVRPRRFKRPVFVACEGGSEAGCIRWLNRLADAQDIAVAFTARDMKGGNPADIAERSIRFLQRGIGGPRTYRGKYLFLDRDLSVNSKQVLDRAVQIAKTHSFHIVWQHICHEGFLLKHFSETENLNPPNVKACEATLLGVWPDYRKGLDAIGYESRLTIENLARARGNLPNLGAFLNDIGWN